MTPSWAWAGARAIGTAHLQSGAPCQDAFACHVTRPSSDSEILIAALADGAGSAARAEAGAKLATSMFVDVVREHLEVGSVSASQIREVVRLGVEAARIAVAAIADHEARATDDFASTLLVAILHADGGAVGQIGDGAIVVTDGADQDWRPALWPCFRGGLRKTQSRDSRRDERNGVLLTRSAWKTALRNVVGNLPFTENAARAPRARSRSIVGYRRRCLDEFGPPGQSRILSCAEGAVICPLRTGASRALT